MNNAGVMGHIKINVRSLNGEERTWEFDNAIMDYGLEFLANASLRGIYTVFPEVIISDGEQPIKLTDLNPNYEEKYFRSTAATTSVTNTNDSSVLCNGNYNLNVLISNKATFDLFGGNTTPNERDLMFKLREISLMAGHNTNTFDNGCCAVFAKSKMKDTDEKPFTLDIYSGDMIEITYDIRVVLNVNMGNNKIAAMCTYPNKFRGNESYENDSFYCRRVKSTDPTEAVFNFEVKAVGTTSVGDGSSVYAYVYTGLFTFQILIASIQGYVSNSYIDGSSGSTAYLYVWPAVSKHHIRLKYTRYNEPVDLTIDELKSKCSITKRDNLTYSYTVPNGSRIIIKRGAKLMQVIACDTLSPAEWYPTTIGNFNPNYTDSPFYDYYIQYKELPLLYLTTLKGIDKVAPYITSGKWETPQQYSFYTETPSTLIVTLFGGYFNDSTLSLNDVNMSSYVNTNQQQLYGDDVRNWKIVELKARPFEPDDNTEFMDVNKSIGKYYLDLPITLKDFQYFIVNITDSQSNTYTSGRIFTERVDYQPEDINLNYADYTSENNWIAAAAVDSLCMNLQVNNIELED